MKTILALLLLVFAAQVNAAGMIIKMIPNETSYETLEDAATHALYDAYKLSNKYESAGLIFQNNTTHHYIYTKPYTTGESMEVGLIHTVTVAGYTLVADYHTHVCHFNYYSQYFSVPDIFNNTSLKEIGFMADLCAGDVHEFDPTAKYTYLMVDGFDQTGNSGRMLITGGKIVGHFKVKHSLAFDAIQ